MTAAVFVDTNVLLYARDQSEPVKRVRVKAWLDHLWRERLGRTGIQVLSEFYYNATRKLHPGMTSEDAWGRIQTYLTWGPQPIDQGLLKRAHEVEQRYRLSWWDSMVVGAAQLQGCAVLLTEDLQDGVVFGGVDGAKPLYARCARARGSVRGHPGCQSQAPSSWPAEAPPP